MYAWLVFLITLTEVAFAGGSLLLESDTMFSIVAIYGSPFFLVMHLSTLFEGHFLYPLLLAGHAIKYFFFFMAQVRGEQNILFVLAILFEAIYLGICGYYLN